MTSTKSLENNKIIDTLITTRLETIYFLLFCSILVLTAIYFAVATTINLYSDFNNHIDVIQFNRFFFSLYGFGFSIFILAITDFRILFNMNEISHKGKLRLSYAFIFGFFMAIGGPFFADIFTHNHAEQAGYEYCTEKSGRDLLGLEDTYAKMGKCSFAK